MKVLQHDDHNLKLLLDKVDGSFVNSLRRLIMDEVPTMAIEDVEFRKNDSILYDEMVAHRLGLVPLTTDLSSYDLPPADALPGERGARYEVDLILKTKASGFIDAGKMKSNDPKIVPAFEKIPITFLTEGQELEFIAKAILGKGKEHSKWSPGLAWFRQKPSLEVKKGADAKRAAENLAKTDADAVSAKAGSIKADDEKLMTMQSVEIYEDISPDDFTIKYSEDEYVFCLESWGQLKPKEIVNRAVEEMNTKLDNFKVLLKDLK